MAPATSEVGATFHAYSLLPSELKNQIVESASLPRGMHHFKVASDRFVHLLGGDGVDRQVLKTTPLPAASDNSAWRVRAALRVVDKRAYELLERFKVGSESMKVMWPQEPIRKSGHRLALVDVDQDLICINFVGIVLPTWIRPLAREQFSKIRRVALSYTKGKIALNSPLVFPFRCVCVGNMHDDSCFCADAVNDFISYFPDLEDFFFVVKLTKDDIKPPFVKCPPPATRGRKRDMHGNIKVTRLIPPAKPSQKQLIETMRSFRKIAQEKNYYTCEDKKFQYFEVKEADTGNLKMHDDIWQIFREVELIWRRQKSRDENSRQWTPPNTQLKVLVYADYKVKPDTPI
ncbi:hypothetical protein M426DRAFT_15289 [Hypoxylon sp. CI-4A]|nr:hypothetical protein M426DRAFT_15289 [Hypoxylon sp. CI-4A]